MAKKKMNRIQVCMKSTESKLLIYTHRKKGSDKKLELNKYDKTIRKHVKFVEIKKAGK